MVTNNLGTVHFFMGLGEGLVGFGGHAKKMAFEGPLSKRNKRGGGSSEILR